MILAYPRMGRLVRDLAINMQSGGLGVEVEGAHPDEEVDVDAVGGCGAGGGFGVHATDGGGVEEVGGLDEVVGVPLCGGWGLVGQRSRLRAWGFTMSSDSSGLRVTVPEPSRSMRCLMSCILVRGRVGMEL